MTVEGQMQGPTATTHLLSEPPSMGDISFLDKCDQDATSSHCLSRTPGKPTSIPTLTLSPPEVPAVLCGGSPSPSQLNDLGGLQMSSCWSSVGGLRSYSCCFQALALFRSICRVCRKIFYPVLFTSRFWIK